MSLHSNFQPARKGLTDARITAAKHAAIAATMKTPDAKRSVMTALYGGSGLGEQAVLARICTLNDAIADHQRSKLRYSDTGDFTRCYRGGF